MDLEWSIQDPRKGARTTEETLAFSTYKKSKKQYSYTAQPIFTCIPPTRVIIDPLHLFLQIMDNLTNLLITELRRIDGIKKSPSANENGLLNQNENFLNQQCKIPFKWFTSKESKNP